MWIPQGGSVYNEEVAEEMIESFVADNPDLFLTIIRGDGGLVDNMQPNVQISTLMLAGTIPDLAATPSMMLFYYAQMIQSMEPYIEIDPSFDRDDFHDMIYEYNLIGNEMWALSCSATPTIMVYNKDLFEIHGLDPEKPPERWSQMLDAQKVFTKHDAQGFVYQTGWGDQHLDTYWGNWFDVVTHFYEGKSITDGITGTQLSIDTDSVYETIMFYRQMADYYGGGRSGLSSALLSSTSVESFRAGRLAMRLSYSVDDTIGLDFSVGVNPFPNSDQSPEIYTRVDCGDNTYVMLKDCDNPIGAWWYLMWYNTNGLIISENYNYKKSVTSYMPRYMTNKYTKTRLADIYYDYLEPEAKENIQKRDHMIENTPLTYARGNTYWWHGWAMNPVNAIIDSTDASVDIQAVLKESQLRADETNDNWHTEMIDNGWEFPVDFPWGIPPVID
jgi:ABC-type glycerol-3-phosphate transport system substrate-binding protein